MIPDLETHIDRLIEGGFGLGVGTLHSRKPYIFSVENFLSHAECDYIINLAEVTGGLEPSSVLNSGVQPTIRNSSGMGISVYYDDVMKTISSRVAELVGMTRAHAEPMQLLRYYRGEFYDAHHDTFPEDQLDPWMEYPNQQSPHGQRVVTAIINLNDDFGGGYTVFPKINKYVVPQKGKCTVFQTADANGKQIDEALHQAEMVAGDKPKWLCNFWFREHPRSIIQNET